ncbi:pilin [Bacillus thuringiensis]|uniref:pilin n=1 Tax=Bacillus thuringiensis TaxID=1428 RepID=UPI00078986A8|nr:pilin [Bacillus thuringiensis]AMR88326.1 hypothetical protein A3L20_30430 [Bacillus thuringiensis]MBG9640107.1 hypothetical protein [Bacillus thuringiensis]MBG9670715.1 hypothetical protein [Bacillus thuringiensis]MEC3299220.1 pilin [Bacillus thuringiensis]MEC3403849.1 pilin [Bacillus thuringiensis]
MNEFISTIGNFTTTIKPVAPALAGLILVIIGFIYMVSKDPQRKEQCTGWMINVVKGFCIIYLGIAIVSWLSGQVVGFG